MGFTKFDNGVLERWCQSEHFKLKGRVLLLVARHTWGWQRSEWKTSISAMARLLGHDRRVVRKAVGELVTSGELLRREDQNAYLFSIPTPEDSSIGPKDPTEDLSGGSKNPTAQSSVGPKDPMESDQKILPPGIKGSHPNNYRKKEKENLKKAYVQGSERGGSSAHAREAEPSDPPHTKGGQEHQNTGTPPPSEHPEESATTTGGLDDPGGRQALDGPAGTDGGGGDDLSPSSDGGESWPEGWPIPGTRQAPGADRWEATRLLSYWHSYAQELLGAREEDELALAEHITSWWPGGWLMEICGYAAGAVPQGHRYARLVAMLERQTGTGPGG